MAAPALALAPLALSGAKKGAEVAAQFAQTPVIGWERTVTYRKGWKNPKEVTEHSSFELRAWELAALAGAGALFYWIFLDKAPSSTQGGLSTNPAAWFFGGPVGAWLWGTATGH